MKSKARKRISCGNTEYVMWLLEGRTDLGPFLRLLNLLHGTVDDYLARRAWYRLAKKRRIALINEDRSAFRRPRRGPDVDETVALKVKRQAQKWNGRWHMVTYDLPGETQAIRRALIHTMRMAGLGMLSLSSWISPYDWADLITRHARESGASRYLVWMRDAEILLSETDADFPSRIWPLSVLSRRYDRLVKECRLILAMPLQTVEHQQAAVRRALRVFQRWTAVRQDDPMLPAPLLPGGWPVRAAEQAIGALRERLSALAAE